MIRLVLTLASLAPLHAVAAELPGIEQSGLGLVTDVVLGLGVTILCIYALSAIAKKMMGAGLQGTGTLKVVTGISVGARERLLVVQVQDEQILLGVSPAGIQRLHQLSERIEPQATAAQPSLPPVISQLLGGGRRS